MEPVQAHRNSHTPVAAEVATFGEIKTIDFAGSRCSIYSDVRDLAAALKVSQPERIMTKTASMLFAATYSAAFIDEKGTVHGMNIIGFKGADDVKPLYDVINGQHISEVDGIIKFSPTNGDVYHLYSPDSDEESSIQNNYEAYITAATTVANEGDAVARIVIQGEAAILNIRRGRHHLITQLPLNGERSLDAMLNRFPGVPVSNESWVAEIKG